MTVGGRRIPLAPSEGWLTLGLVLVLCLTLAWAVDDVRRILGRGEFTDFLAPMAVFGVLVSFVGVKVGWSRWLTYLIGAVLAALVVPLAVGSLLPQPDGALGQLAGWYHAAAQSVVKAVIDAIENDGFTTEYGHYMVVLGVLIWGTAMFASYAVFGHRRPLNAIVIVGLVLLVNMSLTFDDQLFYLVVFSLASLLLLVRYHVLDEQAEWARRRIGDPGTISSVYLRGGTVFITVTVVAALLLTNIARSKPLEGSLTGLSGTFLDISRGISRFVPTGGDTRAFGSDFDPFSTGIQGQWQPNPGLVATIKVPLDAPKHLYWRAATYDQFTGTSWQATESPAGPREVPAGDALLDGTAEGALLTGTSELTFSVAPMANTGNKLLSPATPAAVDKDAAVTLVGETGYLDAIERREGGPYTVTAAIRGEGNKPGQLNAAALRAAGTDYPEEVLALYTGVPDDAIPAGGFADRLYQELLAGGPSPEVPYDFAEYLRQQFVKPAESGGIFRYETDVSDLMVSECKDISRVECFAEFKRGFCQWYATTMAVFLREAGIPARVAEGYLPGNRVQGVETIRGDSRHQWVEVYFPGYGWVLFDPTGQVAQQGALPPGPAGASFAVPSTNPFAAPSFDRDRLDEPNDRALGAGGRFGAPVGSFIAIAILLAVSVGAVAFVVWQRGPRSGTSADHAYRTVTRLAARFGFGPRPNQTVYEYSSALGEVLPIARPELEVVAAAKVETAYGGLRLDDERIRALRAAERKLRVDLLRLLFRRTDRRGRRP